MGSLKNELFGAWRLLSYIKIPIDGGDSYFPLGKSPKGILLYNPEGFMSLHISASEEIHFDIQEDAGTRGENAWKRPQGYIAFSGKYTVDSNLACVNYFIETSLHPDWEDTKQVRKLNFEGDVLYQKTVDPIMSEGELVHAYMTWKRMDKEGDEALLLTEEIIQFEI